MKILLATDGSEYSKGAAGFLKCLNLSPDDEVTVFHAVCWIPFLYDRESYCDAFKELRKEIAPRIIDSVLDILKPVNARISTAIEEGSPEECIVDAAVNAEMDMVVMGARGIKGIKSLFIGSVTRAVAFKSPKPVLITKLPLCAKPGGIRMLFATDGSAYSAATGEFLLKAPFPGDTEVVVLNVMNPEFINIPETFVPDINERLSEALSEARSRARRTSEKIINQAAEVLSRKFKNINILSRSGDPSSEILKTADELKTDLIAVGCRGLRGIKGMMGSVSRNILAHSKCSVLIGKTCSE